MDKKNKKNKKSRTSEWDKFEFMTEKEILMEAEPRDYSEEYLLEQAKKALGGELTTIKDLCEFLKVGKSFVYQAIEKRALITYKTGSTDKILVRSILNIVRSKVD